MFKRLAIAAVVAACLPSAVPAAPATTLAREVRAALDYFCKPFADGKTAAVLPGAAAAGWLAHGLGDHHREGAWGRVDVTFQPGDSCNVTVPVGKAGGKELAALDAAAAWAGANGFSSSQARATKPMPWYDMVSEKWARDGKTLGAYAYVNRRKDGMLIPEVSITVR